MRVLAIDPGYDRMGLAVVENDRIKPRLMFSTCVTPPRGELSARLFAVGCAIEEVLEKHTPDVLALETLYFSKNQKTALAVAEVRGIARYLAVKDKLSVFEYTPQQIKVAVTGSGASDKKQIAAMLPNLIALPESIRFDDEYDAIAIGLTCLASERTSP